MPLLIGFNPGEGTQGFWKGLLDELKIFNRALTPLEVAQLAVISNGDFNNDGAVNGADFLMWQRGQTPTPNSAGDFAAWKSNFGANFATPLTTPVPEPGAVIGLWSAAGCLLLMRRRDRSPR